MQCSAGVDEYDMCSRCYDTAAALSATLWPHPHGRGVFILADTPTEDDDEGADEADSAARAAAEALPDSFFATSGASPRQLAPAFAAQPMQGSPRAARSAGDDSPQHPPLASPAVESLQAPMSEQKL